MRSPAQPPAQAPDRSGKPALDGLAERLAAALAAVGAAATVEDALEALLRGAVRLLDGHAGVVRLLDPDSTEQLIDLRLDRTGQVSRDCGRRRLAPGSFGAAVASGGPAVLVDDFAALDPAAFPHYESMRRAGLRSAANVPIDADGRRVGVLHVNHGAPGFFRRADLALAQALAERAGAAIVRARDEEARRQVEARRLVVRGAAARLTLDLLAAEDEPALWAALALCLRQLVECERSVVVYLLDPPPAAAGSATSDATPAGPAQPEPRFVPAYADGAVAAAVRAQGPRRVDGATGEAVRRRAPYIPAPPGVDRVAQPIPGAPDPPGAMMALPLLGRRGPVGAVGVTSYRAHPYVTEEADVAMIFCSHAALAYENLRLSHAAAAKARLDGALLVARTAAHELNNALAPAIGFADLLLLRPEVRSIPIARDYGHRILAACNETVEKLNRLQHIIRLEESPSVMGPDCPVLDLERSASGQ